MEAVVGRWQRGAWVDPMRPLAAELVTDHHGAPVRRYEARPGPLDALL